MFVKSGLRVQQDKTLKYAKKSDKFEKHTYIVKNQLDEITNDSDRKFAASECNSWRNNKIDQLCFRFLFQNIGIIFVNYNCQHIYFTLSRLIITTQIFTSFLWRYYSFYALLS
jgi:hypothetical protein